MNVVLHVSTCVHGCCCRCCHTQHTVRSRMRIAISSCVSMRSAAKGNGKISDPIMMKTHVFSQGTYNQAKVNNIIEAESVTQLMIECLSRANIHDDDVSHHRIDDCVLYCFVYNFRIGQGANLIQQHHRAYGNGDAEQQQRMLSIEFAHLNTDEHARVHMFSCSLFVF